MREGAPTLAQALDAFLDDVGIALAPLTRTTYERRLRCLRELDTGLTGVGNRSLAALTPSTCRALIRQEMDHYAPATVNTFCGALSAFGKFCVGEGWLLKNPMEGVRTPKIPQKPPRYLPRADLDRVWQAAEEMDREIHTGPKSCISMRTAVLLLSVGLRAAEACSVRREDVDEGLILVKGKGSRYRYVPCPEGLDLIGEGRFLPCTTRTLGYQIHKLGKKAGVPLHPHLFRHSWASLTLIAGVNPTTLQAVGGWRSQRMVEHYTRGVFQKAAAMEMLRFSLTPPAGNPDT